MYTQSHEAYVGEAPCYFVSMIYISSTLPDILSSMFKQHVSSSLLASPHYAVPKRISGVMLGLTAVNGGAAIAVTWNTPVDDVVIDHYEVMYVVPQRPGKTDNSTIENHVITGLMQGVMYNVWVRAVSEVGGHAGKYSKVESITTPVGEK